MVLHESENLLEQKKQQEEDTTYKWEKCFIQQGLIYIIYKNANNTTTNTKQKRRKNKANKMIEKTSQ